MIVEMDDAVATPLIHPTPLRILRQIPLVPDATPRLAVLDLDWEHVRAVDILAVLRSFCPPKGRVQRVTVYPSDYGLERMAEEATAGPQGIWDAGADGKQEDQGGAEEDGEGPSAGNDGVWRGRGGGLGDDRP